MSTIVEDLQAVLSTRCHNLDEQLDVALQLVRAVRTERYKQAKIIAEHLGIGLDNRAIGLRLKDESK